ncbi:MAG TPA: hypothetical protein PLE42_02820 [Candidatus Competibacteraceae bacterium]|nr:hypothetical protein [Candidatus Competibacteraceae bacterium]
MADLLFTRFDARQPSTLTKRFYLIRPSARIALGRGQRARIVDQTLDLLRTRGDLYDFGPGAVLARVTDDARVTPITRDWLHDHLDRVIEYFTLVPSTKPEDPPTEEVADAPQWAAVRILAKDGDRQPIAVRRLPLRWVDLPACCPVPA